MQCTCSFKPTLSRACSAFSFFSFADTPLKVIPISTLLGAIFLIWVDVGARMFDAPGEIPIGIITAMIGAPIFLWMIRVRKYAFGKKE